MTIGEGVLAICFAALLIVAFLGWSVASYLFGVFDTQSKLLRQAKYREKRLVRERDLWQNLLVRRSGMGQLRPAAPASRDNQNEDGKTKVPRVVPASQGISLTRQERDAQTAITPEPVRTGQVPPAIRNNFIAKAGEIVRSDREEN